MDINKLLSPQESPTSESAPSEGQQKTPKRAHTATAPPKSVSSTRSSATRPPPARSHTTTNHTQNAGVSPPLVSPGNGGVAGAVNTPPADVRPNSMRQGSTPGMDTLADLASMQHHQQAARANAGGLIASEVYDSPQLSHAPGYSNISTLPRPMLTPRSSADLVIPESAGETVSTRPLTTASLSEADIQTIAELVPYLAETPYSFDSHVQLIRLLRQGYMNHCASSPESREPHDYELFLDLRQAREAMHARFPLDEDSWTEWVTDEKRACRTAEDYVAVVEIYQKALGEECGSRQLWLDFGETMWSLYEKAFKKGLADANPAAESLGPIWNEEDCALGRELFGWDTVLDTWKQAVRETSLRLNDSHLIWDRYMEIVLTELVAAPTQQKIGHAKDLFIERLQVPHAAWDQTFQAFSTFVTKYDNASYEDTMVNVNKRAADGKSKYAQREVSEIKIQRAAEAGDKTLERSEFQTYLDWELGPGGKKKGGIDFCRALFDRAVLRFPTDASLWEDYVFFALDKAAAGRNAIDVMPVLDRATRHCPWSGDLWCQYLLSSEKEGKAFQEIEEVKHTATKRGLMDIGGMEEVLKVHTAWCGYLNRRAFQDKATDEEEDVAEFGIRSALESVKELGQKKYGEEYTGDHRYRLERIYVEYLTRSNRRDRARSEVWQPLAKTRGDSYEFWIRWYHWEMFQWAQQLGPSYQNRLSDPALSRPVEATSVLRRSIQRKYIDWPEKVMEVFLHHLEHHESVDELQNAMILIRKTGKEVTARRAKEAQEAEEAAILLQRQQQEQQADTQMDVSSEETASGVKRKRGSEAEAEAVEGGSNKKSRADENSSFTDHTAQQRPSPASNLKRDRENNTVVVKNLPPSATETKIRQYFRDCGTINSLKVLPEETGEAMTATIEFEAKDDVLSAQTRDMKTFDGNEIEVKIGTGSTLYVTNFPPTADESFIREQFAEFGDVVDVRFPSLKYNTHRRFCYVQFNSSDQAHRALVLDGKKFEDKYNVVVKISEPARRQDRTGPIHEGREVYASNVDWTAGEDDIQSLFSKYGQVESVRIPKNVAGKPKGVAFVVFATKDEATSATDLNLTKFKSRILYVALSEMNPSKRQATAVMSNAQARSASPATSIGEASLKVNGSGPSQPAGSPGPDPHDGRPAREAIQSRTIALLNIPDTVNDTRIRALMEPYGALTKIVLRPDHQGAIVEFSDTNGAGKASLGVDGLEIAPGRKIGVGRVKELLDQNAEYKSDRIQVGKKKETTAGSKPGLGFQSGPIHRPAQPGGRRGGRGGLGIKRGGVGLGGKRAGDGAAATSSSGKPTEQTNGNEFPQDTPMESPAPAETATEDAKANGPQADKASGVKSNADFRAKFLQ